MGRDRQTLTAACIRRPNRPPVESVGRQPSVSHACTLPLHKAAQGRMPAEPGVSKLSGGCTAMALPPLPLASASAEALMHPCAQAPP